MQTCTWFSEAEHVRVSPEVALCLLSTFTYPPLLPPPTALSFYQTGKEPQVYFVAHSDSHAKNHTKIQNAMINITFETAPSPVT